MINQSKILSKTLTISVILLFIGVGIQPAIAINSIEPDNSELEEITIQFFETDRTYNHTVMLTKEQIEELENLMDDFEIRIDNADNRIETEAIYKDTVVSLKDIGILPEDMSVEKAQRLVTGKEHNPALIKLFERWYKRNFESMDENENILCLIEGRSISGMSCTRGIMTITTPLWNYFIKTFFDLGYINPLFELFFHETLLKIFFYIFTVAWTVRPFQIGFELFFGIKREYPDKTIYKACDLDINTVGLNGKQKFKDKWFGHLPLPPFLIDIELQLNMVEYVYPGALGFTGIKIIGMSPYASEYLLLGSALWVKLGEEPPE